MGYDRPKNPVRLTKAEKLALLKEYADFYKERAEADRSVLNRKVPRKAFAQLLEHIGEVLLKESGELAESECVSHFLNDNPLPPEMASRLPKNFRTFCLALNALKQWVAAEQAATDRYLLGGIARDVCLAAGRTCPITLKPLGADAVLHHPVRDGRPPIALSKIGHALIEEQVVAEAKDNIGRALLAIRRERNGSWAQLRRGCLDLLGKPVDWPSKASCASARSFARKASKVANTGHAEILVWLDERGL